MRVDWEIIAVEQADLAINSVSFLGEGWCSRSYLVNDELVFRFPKRPEHWVELDREVRFLAFAAERLPLAVPRYLHVVQYSKAAAYGYAVYRYLCGHSMDLSALGAGKTAAVDTLAAFLWALHSLDPDPDLRAVLPREDERTVAEEYVERAEREIVEKLSTPEAEALRQQFERYLKRSDNFRFRPVVLHADSARDHIITEEDSIIGVIDFGDVNWGDADYDFMYLFVDFGMAFTMDVARAYGHQDLQRLSRKLWYFAIIDQIGTILDGAGRALAGQDVEAWRRLKLLLASCDIIWPNVRSGV
jgi:aminoglycoside 2''-phosphotransferase